MESVRAAVNNGADAVYLGTKFFNARRLAKNFSIDELKGVVKFCHLHGVKVYLTANTLVKNKELQLYFKILESAYLAGIDAVIIQEVFFAPFIKHYFPGLKVHASTQASFMNYQGINAFKDFDLVVLARELTEREIKEIRKHTKTKLEMFVHGHLCISVSGQCLISSLIGKRSGNRGICASSCRKKYNNSGYLISAKDLLLANHVDRIYAAGIDALKIEGRMKSPEYVGITTRTYRRQIDAAMQGKKNARLTDDETAQLKITFNRDFTSGFYTGNTSVVGKDMPMNRGILLGVAHRNSIRLMADIALNDGISYWHEDTDGKLEGFILKELEVNNVPATSAKKGDIIKIPSRYFKEGTKLFLTAPSRGVPALGRPKYKIFEISIVAKKSEPLTILYNNEPIASDIILPESKNAPLTQEMIEHELQKSTEAGIQWNMTFLQVDTDIFFPKSKLRELRKKLEEKIFETLVPKRTSHFKDLPAVVSKTPSGPISLIVKAYSKAQLIEADTAGVYAIYYDVFNADIESVRRYCKNSLFFVDTPVVITDHDIEKIKEIIQRIEPDGICIGNWGLVNLKFDGEKHGKYSLNVFNDLSMVSLHAREILPTVSVELNAQELSGFRNKEFIYYAHGAIPVMHFKGAFREKSLTDEKGYTFPLRVVNGNTEMLYSRPIASFERIRELITVGVKYFLLDLSKDTTTIIRAYQNIINNVPQDITMLKKGTTIGNFEKVVA